MCCWPEDYGKILDCQWNEVLIPYWKETAKIAESYGVMGGWHVQHAQRSDTVNLLDIYDILPEKRTLAESCSIRAYGSYKDVLADEAVELLTVAITQRPARECVHPRSASGQRLRPPPMADAASKYRGPKKQLAFWAPQT